MKKLLVCFLIGASLISACNSSNPITVVVVTPTKSELVQPTNTIAATTVPPTATILPTFTPAAPLGSIALDFTALLCDAQWMNGATHLKSCPPAGSDLSGGYAQVIDPTTEGLPAGTPIISTVVGETSNAIFLRYPSFSIHDGDRFRATLRCQSTSPLCDIDFRLEYFDKNGKYHSPFETWKYSAGQPPIDVDYDLSSLAGQKVDLVLSIQSNGSGSPQENAGLWIAPYIFRQNP